MSTQSVGERIAEKLPDENVIRGFVNWERIAEIANQEIAASQRNTDTTDSKSHPETGDLIKGIENALKAVERETNGLGDPYDNPEIEVMRQASLRMFESIEKPLRFALALHAQRVKLVSSPDSRSTPTEEKQTPLVAPLVEALRDVLPYLKDAKRCGRGLGTYWQEHAKVAIEKADTALAQAGQEPPKVTREQFVGAMANQMMQGD